MAKVVSRVKGDKVYIAVGAGTKPIEVTWQQGDTVDSVLKRADVIRAAARKGGMITLREDGLRKAAAGITSLQEVITTTMGDAE